MKDSRKIKVVQIIADPSLGGGPKHVLGLLKHLDRSKYDLFLVCPPGYLVQEASQLPDIEIHTLAFKSKFDLPTLIDLRRLLNEIRVDDDPFGPMIVHTHGSRAGFLGRLLKLHGVRYIYTEHRFDADFHLRNSLNEWLQKKTLSWLNFKTDAIIAVSSSVKKYFQAKKLAPAERIFLVPNAIEFDKKVEVAPGHQSSQAPIIGTIGNLNRQKGQRYLIEAMPSIIEKYPLATLEIIGEGEERKNLESLIKKLKLEHHVTLVGKTEKIEKYLSHWSVFVLPSIAETFGIVLLEAMSANLPIVATKVGGVPDVIRDHQDGLLVEAKDPITLSKAVIKVLSDKDLVKKVVTSSKNRLREFDWREVIKKIEAIYDKVV